MAKFLFRMHWGESLPIALRCQSEGHDVQAYIGAEEAREVGDSLVRKAVDLGRAVQWADVVVYESNVHELPAEAERVRAVRPVVGSSALAGRLENDRIFAIEQARKAGLPVSDAIKSFKGAGAWVQARKWLQGASDEQAFVWKPNGESPVSTYVSNDVRELDRMLTYWQQLYIKHHVEPSFILTPKIEGVEVSTEGWWDGSKFALFNHTIERNRLLCGDIGEKTGCSGNVVWLDEESRLAERLVKPLDKLLGKSYRGPVDVNCIIDEETNEPVFLEFTPRFGYDAIFAFLELVEDVGQVLFDCANERLVTPNITDPEARFGAAYRLTVPPYPEEPAKKDETKSVGIPVFGLDTNKETQHFYLVEAKLNSQDELETTGPEGFVLAVGATGPSPEEAMLRAFRQGSKVRIPNMRWRIDLPEAIQKVYNRLERTGWLRTSPVAPISIFGRSVRPSRSLR